MIIYRINEWLCAIGESMEVQLPRKSLKLDPRVSYPPHARFSIRYHDDGITATLHRLDDDYDNNTGDPNWDVFGLYEEFTMRIYDPKIETVPDFTSTVYVYMGLDDERAPSDTTLVIIHPSVKIIQKSAFQCCKKLRRVIMDENVETIERCAFNNCPSLDAMFLPSSIKKIGDYAFCLYPNLRILSIPQTIVINCRTLSRITKISNQNYDQVKQALIVFNRNLPPLHKVCLNTNVSAQSIRQCIDTHGIAATYNTDYGDGMTPMHILALNPHADTGAILTLLHANMGVVFETYSEGYDDKDEEHSAIGGKTLLECLSEYDVDSYLSTLVALCRHREAHLSRTVEVPTT